MLDPARLPGGATDWSHLDSLTDDEVEARATADSDAQPASEAELRAARRLYPPGTEPVLLPIDQKILDWFRAHSGQGDFRDDINRALREYVSARR